MKFGVNTFIWSDRFGQEQIPLLGRIRDAGFDGLEIPLFQPEDLKNAEVRRAIAASGLECSICSVLPENLSMIHPEADVRRRTVSHLRSCIEVSAETGCRLIAGPLYSPVGYLPGRRRTLDEWTSAVDSFQQIGSTLDEFDVSLAIEPLNRYETYFLNTAADGGRLCGQINHPRIGVLFDTYHANIEEKDVAVAIRNLGPHLMHFHSCENDRGTPGSGHIEWHAVLAALRSVAYDRWMTIESFGFSLGALSAAASIWRDLAISPEAIAFDGVKFLRQAYAEST